jgi:hypothetical protein
MDIQSDGYLGLAWVAVVVAPGAVEAAVWAQCWKEVNAVIHWGMITDQRNMDVVEPPGEEAALEDHASWFDVERWHGVGTGSLAAVKAALEALQTAQ